MLSALGEILLQLLFEILLAPIFEGAVLLLKRFKPVDRFIDRLQMRLLPLAIITTVGVLAGAVWVGLAPSRLLATPPFPGLSLLLAPLAAGLLFFALGRGLAAQGRSPSILFTFWGGAMLALGVAAARLSAIWTL